MTSDAVGAAEPEHGLEALGTELAGVEPAAQVVERGAVLLAHAVARDLEQDQVARAPDARGHAHEALAVLGLDAVDPDDDARVLLQALEDGGVEQLRGALLGLLLRDAAGEQRANAGEREHGAAVLEGAADEAVALLGRPGDDDDEAARRVAHAVGRAQHARAHREVRLARRAPFATGAVGRPGASLVVVDLDAARTWWRGHDVHPDRRAGGVRSAHSSNAVSASPERSCLATKPRAPARRARSG